MMRVGLFYASNTGDTEDVAAEVTRRLGPLVVDSCRNIEALTLDDLQGYDVLILGVATWDMGDLPYDWAVLYEDMIHYDFTGTKVVMFGLGDQLGYPETFLDAMGMLYRKMLSRGAQGGFGFWPVRNYRYDTSLAQYEDNFCGLAIDEDNESNLTSVRIEKWCNQIKRELGIMHLCYSSDAPTGQSPALR